jgi:hydrogenase nickel incorporation protein HypA/HybF
MHEMSLCESIVQTLEEQAGVQQYQQVQVVRLLIGALSGVEESALRFGFDVVTRGTLAEGAQLEIEHVAAQAWCLPCAKTVEIQQRYDACPSCGSYQLQVTAGEELQIKELEVQ